LREKRIPPIYQQPLSGHYFLLRFANGEEIRSRSLWDESLQAPETPQQEVIVRHQPGPNNAWLLVRSAAYEKEGRSLVLTVAEDLSPSMDRIRQFQDYALGVFLLALILILLVQIFVLRRGFKALDRVRHELGRINAGQQRQLDTLGPTEILPLTREINHLTGQLQQRLKRSRQALGNLAHALKSPLSLLVRDLDACPMPKEDKERFNRNLDRIRILVERELKRARMAGEAVGERFQPQRHVPGLMEALQRMHSTKSLQMTAEKLPDAAMPFDVEDMLELLGNLMDNACQWAQSRVTLEIWQDEAWHLRISDDGPGVSDKASSETLMFRGVRLDEQGTGHGLGLSIVSDLVQAYQGQIHLSSSKTLGGLEVQIRLPQSLGPGSNP
jgi:signal transduction histidine kinase